MRAIADNQGSGTASPAGGGERGGFAMVPALVMTSLLAMLGLSMLMSHLSGARVVNNQGDEYTLKTAMESVARLTTERIWSKYLADPQQAGVPGNILSFRLFLNDIVTASTAPIPADADDGVAYLSELSLPSEEGEVVFGDARIESLQLYRHDVPNSDATNLFITVQAHTDHGSDLTRPPLERTMQLVYTVEPRRFEGFDFGVLANNVNCIFCHTVVDSADRYWNTDPLAYGDFDRVRVGTLESLSIRDDKDGTSNITDGDSDSHIAGALYVRGTMTDHDGVPISAWHEQTFGSFDFDAVGRLVQDDFGDLIPTDFSPAGNPPQAGENLYLDYPTDYQEMVDGGLPTEFPPPFPDDGGIDPATGEPVTTGANNNVVDPSEFWAVADGMEGRIVGGAINVTPPGDQLGGSAELIDALTVGNTPAGIGSGLSGNVTLTGTADNPIVIDGDVAIQGDLVITGYIVGEGTLNVSGNVYVPAGLHYLDGVDEDGARTFGVGEDGLTNALGLTAGGNIMVGDFLKPRSGDTPGPMDIVTGGPGGQWNFALAELALFNRGEWSKAQPLLPGFGEATDAPGTWTLPNPDNRTHPLLPGPDDDLRDPSTWSAPNPNYDPSWMPRYYQFGPGDAIPVYNLGSLYYDPVTGTWRGDTEAPTSWDSDLLSMWDPSDIDNPNLYGPGGQPVAAVLQLSSDDAWLSDLLLKEAIEHLEALAPPGPMQIDGLMYTNNAIFGIVSRADVFKGQLLVNGALICADLGLLSPGFRNSEGFGTDENPPGSPWATGLHLNYDARLRDKLNVANPNSVTISRSLWNPASDAL